MDPSQARKWPPPPSGWSRPSDLDAPQPKPAAATAAATQDADSPFVPISAPPGGEWTQFGTQAGPPPGLYDLATSDPANFPVDFHTWAAAAVAYNNMYNFPFSAHTNNNNSNGVFPLAAMSMMAGNTFPSLLNNQEQLPMRRHYATRSQDGAGAAYASPPPRQSSSPRPQSRSQPGSRPRSTSREQDQDQKNNSNNNDSNSNSNSNNSNNNKIRNQRKDNSRDQISAPSAESGGVPEPTAAYLLRASFLPQRSPAPRPLLVVIDLNGTLLHRPSSRRAPSRFVARAHAAEFLAYCIDTFHVAVWSSARPDNVRAMLRQLVSAQPERLARVVAVWGRDRFGLSPADYAARTQCYKRLERLWGDPAVAASHPHRGGAWNQGNTVLVDDSAEKARAEPYNALTLPEFTGAPEDPAVLPLVHDYLNTLACQMDVSMYIRAHPFKVEEALLASSSTAPAPPQSVPV